MDTYTATVTARPRGLVMLRAAQLASRLLPSPVGLRLLRWATSRVTVDVYADDRHVDTIVVEPT